MRRNPRPGPTSQSEKGITKREDRCGVIMEGGEQEGYSTGSDRHTLRRVGPTRGPQPDQDLGDGSAPAS